MATGCALYFRMDNLWVSVSIPMRYNVFFCCERDNIVRVKHCVPLFSQTSVFPVFFLLHGTFFVSLSTANIMSDETDGILVRERREDKNIMVNITCSNFAFLFVKQLSASLFTMKNFITLSTSHLQLLHFLALHKLPLLLMTFFKEGRV